MSKLFETNLDILRVEIQRYISNESLKWGLVNHIELSEILRLEQGFKLIFTQKYLSLAKNGELTFQIPKTWKDHFKKTHRDKWWMRRWLKNHPIKFKTLKFDAKKIVVFPDAIVPDMPEFTNHVIYYNTAIKEVK